MCRPVICEICQKITWMGCGEHIDQVKLNVPDSQWCNGEHAQRGQPEFLALALGENNDGNNAKRVK